MQLSICDLRSVPSGLGLRSGLAGAGVAVQELEAASWWRAGLVLVDSTDRALAERVRRRGAGLGPMLVALGPEQGCWAGWAQYQAAPSDQAAEVRRIIRDAPMLCARESARSSLRQELAHDLRTPLGIVSGLTELLQEGLLGPVTKKQWNALSNIDGQTTRLLESLQTLARDVTEPA
jgi:signal transduction histidine kinase